MPAFISGDATPPPLSLADRRGVKGGHVLLKPEKFGGMFCKICSDILRVSNSSLMPIFRAGFGALVLRNGRQYTVSVFSIWTLFPSLSNVATVPK